MFLSLNKQALTNFVLNWKYLFGKIFPPEVQNDVFIERGINNVFDKHLKLSEIRNIKGLERYGNGFFKVTKT